MAASTKIVLKVEYDGSRYYGFQLQAKLPTIQGEIESALLKLTGKKIRIIGASRTDTGVHARAQMISFRTDSSLPLAAFGNGLNYYLNDDIAVKAAFRVSDDFDVRRRPTSREYKYRILNSRTRSPIRQDFSYLVSGKLDVDAMDRACQALIGKHDLISFASDMGGMRSTVRNVYEARVDRDGDVVTFTIVGSSFLPHQVRNTVGALLRVGRGKMTVAEFYGIVEAKRPGMAGPTAPASGLCLEQINYPEPFEGDCWGN